jgi:uncharacterized membrane protein YecN with MAPEG domain
MDIKEAYVMRDGERPVAGPSPSTITQHFLDLANRLILATPDRVVGDQDDRLINRVRAYAATQAHDTTPTAIPGLAHVDLALGAAWRLHILGALS